MNKKLIHQWLEKVLGKDIHIKEMTQMKGGISSPIYRIKTSDDQEVVLRQFTNKEWLGNCPDLALHEAKSLECAAKTGVPSPKIIAFDEKGFETEHPTVLMSVLEGEVILDPDNRKEWLRGLAQTLATIHTVDVNMPWNYYTYNRSFETGDLSWSSVPDQWLKAIQIVKNDRPHTEIGFIHRDYHPANVLWKNNEVSGVVDWVNACIGPRGVDVGHCRLNLAQLHGVDTADAFLDEYLLLTKDHFSYHPYWEILSLIECLPGPPEVYRGWTELNKSDLTNQLLIERLDQYLLSLLNRFVE
ncbi:phosphotransferase family protein [Alkaliphilus hydrothermalis]|uniref:Aminoglycoside phosphotransferase (APT) family kinase protein n=1 Tax=Alkaliphilus hydrothermalis TaxID=1482730 RepID=A0ABS2NLS4_9FIRM|nr:aminoglycoside phosphotransferase family protein [Alkaliphilus hydrothermalis]MBM7613787.1 aminoglycoside phosphotransferase (APT) family kinase protein [Alkaliphilus hydrothermalis]